MSVPIVSRFANIEVFRFIAVISLSACNESISKHSDGAKENAYAIPGDIYSEYRHGD